MTAAPLTTAPDLLAAIIAATRRIVALRQTRESRDGLERMAVERSPKADDFRAALSLPTRINVMAECKRRSPSRGILRRDYDVATIARSYESAGAAAVSVLTEPTFFDGSLADLNAVRNAVGLPVLRKDFIVDEYQLLEARAHGADAVLLIVAALSDKQLEVLQRQARALGLATLVEVHDVEELDRALGAGADTVGVNNRNLHTLEVDMKASDEVMQRMPPHVTAVSESGLRRSADLARLRAAGYHAFLIGEHLMMSADPGMALRELLGERINDRCSIDQ